jgi:hypothetical protein
MGWNYVVWVTSRKDGKHELSATVEQGAGSKIAKILGDYTSRGITTYGITYVSSNLVNITNSTDLNRFFPWDTVVTNGTTPTACTIIKISSDGKSLTLSGTGAPSDATTIRLNAPETTGLIDTYAAWTQGNIVIDWGSSYLPYSY